jgi:GNAT superfamily N-acetyltransferase
MTIEISDLSSEIKFCPLSPEADFELSFRIKKSAMGPIIMQKWEWDETYQRNIHRQRLSEKPFYFVQRNNRTIGTLSLLYMETYVRFGEFYLLSELHHQGLGTKILQHCLTLTDEACLPVRLEYLKWNPVGTLYERHGFRTIGESDIHWFMERVAQLSIPDFAIPSG